MSSQLPRPLRAVGASLAAALLATALGGCHVPGTEKTLPAKQLKQELLTAPAGSTPFARGTYSPNGILTVDQFVDGVFDTKDQADEKDFVTRQDLRYAAQTNWVAPDGSSVDVYLLQFGASDGAQAFISSVSDATAQNKEPQEPLSSLAGVPGGEGWSAGAVDDEGDIDQIAWFRVGNIAVDLHYFTPASARPAELDQLAKAQRARLVNQVTTPSPLPLPTDSAPPAPGANASATAADKKRVLADLVAAPHGSHPWPSSKTNGATGVLTLDQLLDRLADTAADRTTMSAEGKDQGFQYAVRKNWDGADGTQADVYLLQFASATGAQSFILAHQQGAKSAVPSKGLYTIPNSGDAVAYERPGIDHDGYVWTDAYFVFGNVAVRIDFWVPAKAHRSELTALVQQQYAKLLKDSTLSRVDADAPALPGGDS
ncbi:hypothetical protein [Streptacidiphilus cavernicola]|uniref:Lipoprotein n=1 Tax=Streptacidiphilus cavernicola TaxID=3342716 RepID=A0ABV6VST3_9ACTN